MTASYRGLWGNHPPLDGSSGCDFGRSWSWRWSERSSVAGGANLVALAGDDPSAGVVDVKGPCDEAEHANDPECQGPRVTEDDDEGSAANSRPSGNSGESDDGGRSGSGGESREGSGGSSGSGGNSGSGGDD